MGATHHHQAQVLAHSSAADQVAARHRVPPTHSSCSLGLPMPASAPLTRPLASSGSAPALRPSCCRCAASHAGCSCGAQAATPWAQHDQGTQHRQRRPLAPPRTPPLRRGWGTKALLRAEPPWRESQPPRPMLAPAEQLSSDPHSPACPRGCGHPGICGADGQCQGCHRLLWPLLRRLVLLQKELRQGTVGTGCCGDL